MKRPVFYWVCLFVLGEILSGILPIKWIGFGVFVIVVLFSAGFYLFNKKQRYKGFEQKCGSSRERKIILTVGFAFFIYGLFFMENAWQKNVDFGFVGECEVNFVGEITKIESNKNDNYYIVKVLKMEMIHDATNDVGYNVIRHVYIKLQPDIKEKLMLGSVVAGLGKVEPFSYASNPGEYDEQSNQYGQGIVFALKDVEFQRVYQPMFPVREMLHRIREHFAKVYDDILTEQSASLAKAMVLGDKANLDSEIKQLYQRNGIAHLIAISGLHIAMIGGSLYRILRKRLGGYVLPAGIGIVFIIFYGMMTGLTGATMRAVLMIIISIGAELFGRRYDMMTAMAAALFFMLLQNPYQITQAGFLLSFGAVLGIAVIYPVWKKFLPHMPVFLEGLFVSFSVQAAILPILLYYFYEFPVYSVFLNIIVVPLMTILLALLLFGGMLGSFFPKIAGTIMVPAQCIFKVYEVVCNISEKLPFHTICTGRPAFWWILVYYGGMFLFLFLAYVMKVPKREEKNQGKRKKADIFTVWLCAATIFYGLLFGTFLFPRPLTVCMFDVGQGDGIYIRTPGGKHILMDGGSSSKNKIGTYILKNGVQFYGAKELDYVFISHSDSDHYSGISELLENDLISIRNIVMPAVANPDEDYLEFVDMAQQAGCKIYYMKSGDYLDIDKVSFLCLHPEPIMYPDKNTGSLVLCLSYGSFDMLLTGDADKDAEKEVLNMLPDKTIEVLKVAHHGSATSSSTAFLEHVQPEVACISVGEKNHYGHPADEVMDRLRIYADKIYLTKDSGAITIETDGTAYRLIPFRTD